MAVPLMISRLASCCCCICSSSSSLAVCHSSASRFCSARHASWARRISSISASTWAAISFSRSRSSSWRTSVCVFTRAMACSLSAISRRVASLASASWSSNSRTCPSAASRVRSTTASWTIWTRRSSPSRSTMERLMILNPSTEGLACRCWRMPSATVSTPLGTSSSSIRPVRASWGMASIWARTAALAAVSNAVSGSACWAIASASATSNSRATRSVTRHLSWLSAVTGASSRRWRRVLTHCTVAGPRGTSNRACVPGAKTWR